MGVVRMKLWHVILIFIIFWSAIWIFQAKFINDIWPPRGRSEWIVTIAWLILVTAISTSVVYGVEKLG